MREIWNHEALDLTKWLQDNIDVLNDVLDLSLSNVDREKSAGDFNVDLVAEDGDGSLVVIENQLEKSDHAHLGKLITYLTAIGAKKAIWIVSAPRPEHVAAITWLNETTDVSFFLLKIEGIRIRESDPAPLLTLIVGPSEEGRELGETKKALAGRDDMRLRFWTELLARAKEKTKLHANISPRKGDWLGTSSGKRGLSFTYVIRNHYGVVELYIDRGQDADEENKSTFDSLAASREAIEREFGEPLEWQRLEGKRACRVRKVISLGGLRHEPMWGRIQDALIDAMIRLEKAFKPYISKLPL